MRELRIQICPESNPFNWMCPLLMVIVVVIERRLSENPSTTRTHWRWGVSSFTYLSTDLPSLTRFTGYVYNLGRIGSVILESIHWVIDWCRYPSLIIQWNPVRCWLLLVHPFPPIFKYAFSHFIIFRCVRSGVFHQFWTQITLANESCCEEVNRTGLHSIGCERPVDWAFWCNRDDRLLIQCVSVIAVTGDWEWRVLGIDSFWTETSSNAPVDWYWRQLFLFGFVLLPGWFDWLIGLNW